MIAVLAGALVASAIVVYALVRITAPSGGDGAVTDPTATTQIPDTADSSSGARSVSDSLSAEADSGATSGAATTDAESSGALAESQVIPSATTLALPQSRIVIPATWSGVATVTVTVLGECAASTPSVYAGLPADLALDLVQNEASAAEIPLPEGADPHGVTLTVGVNPSGVPAVALYSSQIDESGQLRRYWDLTLSSAGDRMAIDGRLVAQPTDGSTPNMMVDAETSLQPCESLGTVSLPRALADGATLSGWVTDDKASLKIHGETTDGRRTVTVELTAARKR